ncbi:DUF4935 domain-containing protein [Alicyclobacillus curvatus]|nr:DUF4935 domain-containing protein [Alicyclobacillus curvatus]
MGYVIILDANAIIAAGYRINSSPTIKPFITSGDNKIVIPSVVRDEVLNNYTRDNEDFLQNRDALQSMARRLGVRINIDADVQRDFPHDFDSEIRELGVDIIDISQADIALILRKAQNVEKPFKKKHQGNNRYKEAGGVKDVIIWSLILSYLENKRDEKIVLVTQDSDFLNRETGSLYDDLVTDLTTVGVSKERLTVLHSMKDLVTRIIEPSLPNDAFILSSIKQSLESNGSYLEFKTEDILDMNPEEFRSAIHEAIDSRLGDDRSVTVDYVEQTTAPHLRDIRMLEENLAYLSFTTTLKADFDYLIASDEYYVMDDETRRYLTVLDDEWNDWTLLVQETWYFDAEYEATIDVSTGELQELVLSNDLTIQTEDEYGSSRS